LQGEVNGRQPFYLSNIKIGEEGAEIEQRLLRKNDTMATKTRRKAGKGSEGSSEKGKKAKGGAEDGKKEERRGP